MIFIFSKGILFFIIGLVLLTIIILFGKKHLYFYPNIVSTYYNKPDYVEDIWVDHIHCWLRNNDDSKKDKKERKIVIHCHGNAGNIGNRDWLFEEFKNIDCDLLLFDYSGFGMSGMKANETQLYSDAQKIYDHCINKLKYDKNNIIMYGESIGCPIAMKIAQENNINKIVLQSGPHSISQIVYDIFPFGIKWLLSLFVLNDFPTHKYLKKYKGKCLIIHGKNDKIINVDHAIKLNECNDQAELLLVDGGHNVLQIDWEKIKQFIIS